MRIKPKLFVILFLIDIVVSIKQLIIEADHIWLQKLLSRVETCDLFQVFFSKTQLREGL